MESFSKEDEKLKNKTLSEISDCINEMLTTSEKDDLEKRCASRVQGVDHILKSDELRNEDFEQAEEDITTNGPGCNKVQKS